MLELKCMRHDNRVATHITTSSLLTTGYLNHTIFETQHHCAECAERIKKNRGFGCTPLTLKGVPPESTRFGVDQEQAQVWAKMFKEGSVSVSEFKDQWENE